MSTDTLAQLLSRLEQLESDYLKDRKALEGQVSDVRKSQQAAALLKIRELMQENQISADQLSSGGGSIKRASKKPVAPKYRGPNGETWSGRGRPPAWLGTSRDKFKIDS